jgi:hypothetical protein
VINWDPHNPRRDQIEKVQAEARKRENDIEVAMLKRLFPSLAGPTWSKLCPPERPPDE